MNDFFVVDGKLFYWAVAVVLLQRFLHIVKKFRNSWWRLFYVLLDTTYTKYSTLVWEDSHWSVANFGSKIHFSAHCAIAFLHTTTKQKNSICIKSVQIGSFQKILAHILLKMNFRSTPNGLVMVPIIHLFLR